MMYEGEMSDRELLIQSTIRKLEADFPGATVWRTEDHVSPYPVWSIRMPDGTRVDALSAQELYNEVNACLRGKPV